MVLCEKKSSLLELTLLRTSLTCSHCLWSAIVIPCILCWHLPPCRTRSTGFLYPTIFTRAWRWLFEFWKTQHFSWCLHIQHPYNRGNHSSGFPWTRRFAQGLAAFTQGGGKVVCPTCNILTGTLWHDYSFLCLHSPVTTSARGRICSILGRAQAALLIGTQGGQLT